MINLKHLIKMKQLLFTYLNKAFLFYCLFVVFPSCENNEQVVRKVASKELGVEEAKQVELTYTVGGGTKAILKSPLMLRVQDSVPYVEFPKNISVDFYNVEGKVESHLTAKYARYKETKGAVFIRDSVRVINILKGDTLYCKELYWDRQRKGNEFYTDKPVKIRTRTQIIDGIGMESDQDFKNWHILKPVGTVDIPSSKFPE